MPAIGHNGAPLGDGWIARHRSVREHWLVGHGIYVKPADPSRKRCLSQGEAWEDLLMECRYADGFVENGGRKMRIERGSVVGAVSWLAHRWNWTPQTVRTFLDKLEGDGMIMRHVPGASENNKHIGKVSTIISVCNYDKYQNPDFEDQQSKQQTNNKSAANEQQTSNNIYKEEQGNKGTREQEEKTPLPPAGEAREARAAVNRKAAQAAFSKWQEFSRSIGLRVPRDSTYEVFGKKLAARLFEHAADPRGLDEMMAVFDLALVNIGRSKFLRGMATNFRADLKFLCQRESFAKIINGDYGNGAHIDAPADDPGDCEHDRQLELIRQQREQERADHDRN